VLILRRQLRCAVASTGAVRKPWTSLRNESTSQNENQLQSPYTTEMETYLHEAHLWQKDRQCSTAAGQVLSWMLKLPFFPLQPPPVTVVSQNPRSDTRSHAAEAFCITQEQQACKLQSLGQSRKSTFVHRA
jgi:hypothetical protein